MLKYAINIDEQELEQLEEHEEELELDEHDELDDVDTKVTCGFVTDG